MWHGLRDKDCSVKVFLIHGNAILHRAQFQTLLKDFRWKQFEHTPYSPDLVLSDYHLFQLKKELSG